jgi:hypothetical protein
MESTIIEKKENPDCSLELQDLFSALAKAQADMQIAKTENLNPFYKSKYADLNSVVKASREYLTKNGLCVIQRILTNDSNQMFLFTRLCHSSGQWIESKMPITPPKSDVQSIGSYITYLRRYNYASMVGVTSSEEDDDGEETMKTIRKDSGKKEKKYSTIKSFPINEEQIKIIKEMLSDLDSSEEEKLLNWAQVKSIQSIPSSKFESILQALEIKIRRNKNGTTN